MARRKLTKGDNWIVKLEEPFDFEGKTIDTIDMNGLFDLTGRDLCQIDAQAMARGIEGQMMETTKQYALLAVAKACNQPWEFAENMKARDVIRIKNRVTNFFYL